MLPPPPIPSLHLRRLHHRKFIEVTTAKNWAGETCVQKAHPTARKFFLSFEILLENSGDFYNDAAKRCYV